MGTRVIHRRKPRKPPARSQLPGRVLNGPDARRAALKGNAPSIGSSVVTTALRQKPGAGISIYSDTGQLLQNAGQHK